MDIEKQLPLRIADDILTIGCYSGGHYIPEYIANRCKRMTVVDPTIESPKSHDNVTYKYGDFMEYKLPISRFNKVFCLGYLEQINDEKMKLKVLNRIFKSKGNVIVFRESEKDLIMTIKIATKHKYTSRWFSSESITEHDFIACLGGI